MTLTPQEKKEISEKWDKTEMAKSIKEIDLQVDKFRNKPVGYHNSSNQIVDFWLALLESKLKQQLEKIESEITSVKEAVQQQTGSFKYDDCYDDCLRIIIKHKGD